MNTLLDFPRVEALLRPGSRSGRGMSGTLPRLPELFGLDGRVAVVTGAGRVNAIGPGPIRTPMTLPILEANPALRAQWEARVPLGRLGEPRDLTGMFVYLASDASAWVTGQVLYVKGGWLL